MSTQNSLNISGTYFSYFDPLASLLHFDGKITFRGLDIYTCLIDLMVCSSRIFRVIRLNYFLWRYVIRLYRLRGIRNIFIFCSSSPGLLYFLSFRFPRYSVTNSSFYQNCFTVII